MNRVWRKGWHADRDVFGSLRLRTAVANPLSRCCHHRLTCAYVDGTALMLDANHPTQDDRDLFELRPLTGLAPATRRKHPGHTDAAVARIHAPGEFLNLLRFVASSSNDCRPFNEPWHAPVILQSP